MSENSLPVELRLDKWLWFARLYKTRALALAAIKAGKVRMEGARVKPAHTVRPGEMYTLRDGPVTREITVKATGHRRGPATEAALLYEETAESLARRTLLQAQLRAEAAGQPRSTGRPGKRDRRRIIRFTRGVPGDGTPREPDEED